MCSLQPNRTLFAKNSDRPPAEAQVVEVHPARPAGSTLHTEYLSLPDAGAFALVGSRPTWTWGLEHGVNEHRVAIGNEQIWTVDDPRLEPDGLTGLDLVRLGLERARTAAHAVEVITGLLEAHGQGGAADCEGKAYFSSFLIADPSEAWALETSRRSWAARRVTRAEGGVALSNRISLSTDWSSASADVADAGDFDAWRRATSPTAHADKRLDVTRPVVESPGTPPTAADLVGALRDHDGARWGRPGDGHERVASLPPPVVDRQATGVSVCMHLTGVQATTASMVASLPSDDEPVRVWISLGSPCVGVFVPAFPFDKDAEGDPGVAAELADEATWHRLRTLRDRVEVGRVAAPPTADTELARIRRTLGRVEAALWAESDRLEGSGARATWGRSAWKRVDTALASLDA
jgi:secernin